MSTTPSRKLLAVIAMAIGIVGFAGAASAAWLSTGSGSASARAGSAANSTIVAVPLETVNDLYPGAVKTTKVTINNPNPYPVAVWSISAGSAAATSAGACAAGTVISDPGTGGPLAQAAGATTIPANNGTGVYVLTVRMAADAADACQADTFTLNLTAELRSAA